MGVFTQLVAHVKSVDIHEKTVKLNVAILLVSHSNHKGLDAIHTWQLIGMTGKSIKGHITMHAVKHRAIPTFTV